MTCHNSTAGRGHRYYWCRGTDPHRLGKSDARCAQPTHQAGTLDDAVWSDLVNLLTDPELLRRAWSEQHGRPALHSAEVVDEDARSLRKQITQADKQRQRILVAYEQEAIELDEFVARRDDLQRRGQQLEQRLTELEQASKDEQLLDQLPKQLEAICGHLNTGLETMAVDRRMELCQQLIERVVVEQAGVEIRYRFPVSGLCHPNGERGRLLLPGARSLSLVQCAAHGARFMMRHLAMCLKSLA
jgi:hypothetical protein